eukprot:Amastigsp_a343006_7.p3 type:complete len:103 gc:universal Amastigsp_a343006_7:442-134(-)
MPLCLGPRRCGPRRRRCFLRWDPSPDSLILFLRRCGRIQRERRATPEVSTRKLRSLAGRFSVRGRTLARSSRSAFGLWGGSRSAGSRSAGCLGLVRSASGCS